MITHFFARINNGVLKLWQIFSFNTCFVKMVRMFMFVSILAAASLHPTLSGKCLVALATNCLFCCTQVRQIINNVYQSKQDDVLQTHCILYCHYLFADVIHCTYTYHNNQHRSHGEITYTVNNRLKNEICLFMKCHADNSLRPWFMISLMICNFTCMDVTGQDIFDSNCIKRGS